ncbi:hypothetical protein B0H17DRAFT_1076898, partial [Mycena rosella]
MTPRSRVASLSSLLSTSTAHSIRGRTAAMSTEELQMILSFRESNPTMGVKKIVDSLKERIPSINAKMVRSALNPADARPAEADVPVPAAEPAQSRAQRRAKAAPPRGARSLNEADVATRPKSASLQSVLQMYVVAEEDGTERAGWYPLLAHGNTKYVYEEMVWVDVRRGNEDEGIMFESMRAEATMGLGEAVWILWKMLDRARRETPDVESAVSNRAIAKQLVAEYGRDPVEVDGNIIFGELGEVTSPAAVRLVTLLLKYGRNDMDINAKMEYTDLGKGWRSSATMRLVSKLRGATTSL